MARRIANVIHDAAVFPNQSLTSDNWRLSTIKPQLPATSMKQWLNRCIVSFTSGIKAVDLCPYRLVLHRSRNRGEKEDSNGASLSDLFHSDGLYNSRFVGASAGRRDYVARPDRDRSGGGQRVEDLHRSCWDQNSPFTQA
jgi:hypothetical protein